MMDLAGLVWTIAAGWAPNTFPCAVPKFCHTAGSVKCSLLMSSITALALPLLALLPLVLVLLEVWLDVLGAGDVLLLLLIMEMCTTCALSVCFRMKEGLGLGLLSNSYTHTNKEEQQIRWRNQTEDKDQYTNLIKCECYSQLGDLFQYVMVNLSNVIHDFIQEVQMFLKLAKINLAFHVNEKLTTMVLNLFFALRHTRQPSLDRGLAVLQSWKQRV